MSLKISKAFIAGITFAATLLLSLNIVSAAPAINQPVDLEQADGTVIQVVPRGDEHFNWMEDEDGYVVAFNEETENWCYASVRNEKIVAGTQVVGSSFTTFSASKKITAGDLAPLKEQTIYPDYCSQLDQAIEEAAEPADDAPYDFVIDRELLVVLIEFTDVKLTKDNDYWYNSYFSTEQGANSVVNFYKENSGGYDVFVPIQHSATEGTVTASSPVINLKSLDNIECYVEPYSGGGVIKVSVGMPHFSLTWASDYEHYFGVSRCLALALMAIDEAGFDFTNPNMAIATVFAGYDAAGGSGRGEGQVWGHQWEFWYDDPNDPEYDEYWQNYLEIDGRQITRYMIHGERFNATYPMGIGVSCHELGHVLYLPDLYDYNGLYAGVSVYSVMSGGSWGQSETDAVGGYTPTHMDAWCKTLLRYEIPIEVDAGECESWIGDLKCVDLDDLSVYNVLKVTDSSIEGNRQYFLVENRQLVGYDRGMWRSGIREQYDNNGGILIWHISDDVFNPEELDLLDNPGYGCNGNAKHKAVDLEEADNSTNIDTNRSITGLKHFFVNDSGQNWEFNRTTAPNSNFHVNGHTELEGGTPQTDCHPHIVTTNVSIAVNSKRGASMEVEVLVYYVNEINISSEDGSDVITQNRGSLQLAAEVLPADAAKTNVVWTVDKTSVATIDENGLLTAVWNGIVTVRATATDGSGVYGEFTVIVTGQYTPISVTPAGIITGNKQANVDFAIRSANGKGYTTYISTSPDGPFTAADVNYNSKGAHIKGLKNGTTYYVYIEYLDAKLDIIERTEILTIKP